MSSCSIILLFSAWASLGRLLLTKCMATKIIDLLKGFFLSSTKEIKVIIAEINSLMLICCFDTVSKIYRISESKGNLGRMRWSIGTENN